MLIVRCISALTDGLANQRGHLPHSDSAAPRVAPPSLSALKQLSCCAALHLLTHDRRIVLTCFAEDAGKIPTCLLNILAVHSLLSLVFGVS